MEKQYMTVLETLVVVKRQNFYQRWSTCFPFIINILCRNLHICGDIQLAILFGCSETSMESSLMETACKVEVSVGYIFYVIPLSF